MFDFDRRIALVTGAARGLGRAIAAGLARHGAALAVVDRDADGAEEVARAIREGGGRATAFGCDVGDEDQVRRTVDAAESGLGPIDVLVNNAGITRRIALFDWRPEDWEEVIRVNQVGTFLVAREVGRLMTGRRRGSIVNMSALGGGLVGLGRGNAIYCGTKGAVAAMTRDLAAEWARFGVRVNCVAPGWFRTEMNAPLLKNAGPARPDHGPRPARATRRAGRRRRPRPLPRLRRRRDGHRPHLAHRRRRREHRPPEQRPGRRLTPGYSRATEICSATAPDPQADYPRRYFVFLESFIFPE